MSTRRRDVEFWLPKIAVVLVIVVTLVWGVRDEVLASRERDCREAKEVLESFARCDTHKDCIPTRIDMAQVINSERIIVKRCVEDEAA